MELPHCVWLLAEALRKPQYLLVPPPHALVFALPRVVLIGVALTDVADAWLIALAWRAKRDGSHETADRFLATAGAWLVVTGALRWPPLLAVLDLEDAWHRWPVALLPLRGLVQIAIGVTALAMATLRLRARRAWLAEVEAGRNDVFCVRPEHVASLPPRRAIPLLTRSGAPRFLARRGPPCTTYRQMVTPVARIGDFGDERFEEVPGRLRFACRASRSG